MAGRENNDKLFSPDGVPWGHITPLHHSGPKYPLESRSQVPFPGWFLEYPQAHLRHYSKMNQKARVMTHRGEMSCYLRFGLTYPIRLIPGTHSVPQS
jgi:hypothetical protein